MNRSHSTIILIAALVMTGAGCKNTEIVDALTGIASLNGVCISGYATTVKPRQPGDAQDTLQIQVKLGNLQSEQAKGSIRLFVGISSTTLHINGIDSTFSAQSQIPYFETGTSTTYAANTKDAYVSPVMVSAPYDPTATYKIEIYSWIAGLNPELGDATPCHRMIVETKVAR